MGFGDVKAGAVLGAALGLLAAPLAVLALVLGLLAAATFGLLRRLRTIALGPALVAGAVLALTSDVSSASTWWRHERRAHPRHRC